MGGKQKDESVVASSTRTSPSLQVEADPIPWDRSHGTKEEPTTVEFLSQKVSDAHTTTAGRKHS